MHPLGGGPHVLHVDPVDLVDLADEQRHQARVGELDDQLVDGPARTPLEDVDSDDVAPYRSDPAGHRSQRSGAIGEPNPYDEGFHGADRRDGV